MSDETLCTDCGHKEHEPGRCKFDNCGESAVSHRTPLSVDSRASATWKPGIEETDSGFPSGKRVMPARPN